MPARSATAIGDVSDAAIDDTDGIDGNLKRCSQTPSPRRNNTAVCGLPGTAIVELQCHEHWPRRLQEVTVDSQVTKRTKVRPHGVSAIEERAELALQLQRQFGVGRFRWGVVTSDQ